jgi:uncharacterized coiled-coil protein SlyX
MKNSNSSRELLDLLMQELNAMLTENWNQFVAREARLQVLIEMIRTILKSE